MVPRYACRVRMSADTSISNATNTVITWDGTEDYDYGDLHPTLNPTRIVVPVQGVWRFMTTIQWQTDTTGYRIARFHHNGTLIHEDTIEAIAINSRQTLATEIEFNANDYMEVFVGHNRGSALSVDSNRSVFTASLVMPTSA